MISAVPAQAGETWKMTSLDWQPYSGSDMANQGKSIEKLKELLKKEGITLEIVFYPWLRAKELAKKKEFVGYFPAWPEEVDDGFVASPPVDWSEISILKAAKANITYANIDDLFQKYKVGIVQTYVYPEAINLAAKKYPAHADATPDESALLKKLSAGRDDVAITDPSVMLYLAKKEGISNIEPVETITKKELVVGFRNDEENRHRIDLLKKLLQEQK